MRLVLVPIVAVALLLSSSRAEAQPVEFGEAPPEEGTPQPGDVRTALETGAIDLRDVILMAGGRIRTIQDAPMIVTVITADEIRRGGFRTLEEIMETIPGWEVAKREGHRLSSIVDRGQVHSFLYLLNAVPNYPLLQNSPHDLEYFVDLQQIDRIEIVTGPGGVLWGASAFLGVINIITRSPPRQGFVHEVTAGGGAGPGSGNTLRAFALSGGHLGEARYNVMASYLQTEGPRYDLEDSTFINTGPSPFDQNLTIYGANGRTDPLSTQRYVSATATVEVGDFTFFANVPFGTRYLQTGPGGSMLSGDNPALDEDTEMEDWRFDPHVSVRMRRQLVGEKLTITTTGMFAIHNQEYYPFTIWSPAASVAEVPPGGVSINFASYFRRFGVHTELGAELPANNVLQYGLELYAEHGQIESQDILPVPNDLFVIGGPVHHTIFTTYLQDQWRLHPRLSLDVGTRYTAHSQSGPIVTYSGAVAWNVAGRLYVRGEYNEGFRAPGVEQCCAVKHSGVDFSGDPNLLPESSRAVQGEVSWVGLEDVGPFSRLYLRADYSYNYSSDLIGLRYGYWTNFGERRTHAVEVLARLDFRNRSTLTLGYSFLAPADTYTGAVRYPSNQTINASGTIRLLPWLDVSAVFTRVGAREDLNRAPDLPRNQATMNSIFAQRLDADYHLRAGVLVRSPFSLLRGLELRVFANNIIDVEGHYGSEDGMALGQDKIYPHAMPTESWSVFGDLTYRFGDGAP